MEFLKYVYFLLKKTYLKHKKIFIGKRTRFYRTKFEGPNNVGNYSSVSRSTVGMYSYIGSSCELTMTEIGRFCSIANNVKLIYGRHPTSGFISTHPSFFSLTSPVVSTFVNKQLYKENRRIGGQLSCKIEDDVWIGQFVIILEGIKIGRGSIIAAGSVVTKDVEPYSIIGGNPARKIKMRFSTQQIKNINNSRWWEKDPKWIKENITYLNNLAK